MPSSPSPDKGMLVGIPVRSGCFHGYSHLVPSLKAPSLQGQRTQDFPPRFNQIQVGRIGGLIDKLPARMMDHEQQQVVAMVHVQIIQDRIDALLVCWDLFVYPTEKVDEMHFAAAWVALRPAISRGLPQGPIDIALGSAPIIDFLLGTLGGTKMDIDGLLAWVALGGHRSHLINVENDAICWRLRSQGFDGPLF